MNSNRQDAKAAKESLILAFLRVLAVTKSNDLPSPLRLY